MAKSVVFFDTEIGVDDKKIKDIGAVRSDKGILHTTSVSDFCAFSADADFLCGHNVVRSRWSVNLTRRIFCDIIVLGRKVVQPICYNYNRSN